MTGREEAIRAFIAESGWGAAESVPLAGDASNRRYFRLKHRGRPAVLMDAPPERGEDVGPFVAVTDWLREQGLSAPEILAADLARGLLLLEDLGDDLFARICAADPGREAPLYAAAIDLLAGLPGPPPPELGRAAARHPLPPYDMATLWREAALATDWYLPGATGETTPPGLEAAYRHLIEQAMAEVSVARAALVLRDYHAENLIWLPERRGPARVGLLDYQDARAGHPAYDLVSLLEDARRDTAPALQQAMVARYLERRPDLDPEPFRAAYAALGAQRNLKIVGIFARLCLRDGKARYVDLIPRVWGHLMRDLAHPDLASLSAWVGRALPPPEPGILARLRSRAGRGV